MLDQCSWHEIKHTIILTLACEVPWGRMQMWFGTTQLCCENNVQPRHSIQKLQQTTDSQPSVKQVKLALMS